MGWTVDLKAKVVKQLKRLPQGVRNSLVALIRDIEANGPVRGNWSNYGKLDTNRHHCHLKKGHPTYVAIWQVVGKQIQLVEVIYVGTHEKAPY